MLRIGRCTRVLLARCGGTEAQGRGGGGGRGGRRGYGAGGGGGGNGDGGSSKALPKLCVEGFDVSVSGRALDDDKEVVVRQDGLSLDVVLNTRVLSVRALREAGRGANMYGLLKAAEEGDVSLVTLYLGARVPIDCVTSFGETPLYNSCKYGQLEIVRLLLDRGSTSINKKSGILKRTPLHNACAAGHVELATLLLDRSSTATDEEDSSKSLLKVKDKYGQTPFHNACRYGRVEVARLLLDRGAAIDEKDNIGFTPLHHACAECNWDVARLLLDRGSTAIDVEDRYGDTPLRYVECEEYGDEELAKLMRARLTEKSQARPCPAEATAGAAPESTKRRRVDEE